MTSIRWVGCRWPQSSRRRTMPAPPCGGWQQRGRSCAPKRRRHEYTRRHHGGAWKIAYADFVTAMMAFFLLMWLLGSTTKGDLKGIADYFATPLKVALQGGSGSGDASSVIQGGGEDLSRLNGQVKKGETRTARKTINLEAAKAELERKERSEEHTSELQSPKDL